MSKSKLFLSALFLVVCCFFSSAQVRTNFNNRDSIGNRGRFNKSYKIKTHFQIPAKNLEVLLENESQLMDSFEYNRSFRFAEATAVDLDIAGSIDWIIDSGFAYGTFVIMAEGASSTSINFDRFLLPQDTEMYIYNENGKMMTGPITETENNPNKVWGS